MASGEIGNSLDPTRRAGHSENDNQMIDETIMDVTKEVPVDGNSRINLETVSFISLITKHHTFNMIAE